MKKFLAALAVFGFLALGTGVLPGVFGLSTTVEASEGGE